MLIFFKCTDNFWKTKHSFLIEIYYSKEHPLLKFCESVCAFVEKSFAGNTLFTLGFTFVLVELSTLADCFIYLLNMCHSLLYYWGSFFEYKVDVPWSLLICWLHPYIWFVVFNNVMFHLLFWLLQMQILRDHLIVNCYPSLLIWCSKLTNFLISH